MAKLLQCEEGYIRLLRCFLHPNLMLQHRESSSSLTERQVLELGVNGAPTDLQHHEDDPLHQLFFPDNSEQLGRYLRSKSGGI